MKNDSKLLTRAIGNVILPLSWRRLWVDQPLRGDKVLDLLHVLSGESDLGSMYNYGNHLIIQVVLFWFRSAAQSCPTRCDPMDCSIPGCLVHHQLPVYSDSCPLSWSCHPTISSSVIFFSSCLQSFPASWSFQMSQFLSSVGQSIGVSASASVLPMNI